MPRRHSARAALLAVVLVCLSMLAACGGKGAEVDDSLKTGALTPFRLASHDGKTYAVGHGVVLDIPKDWKTFPEKDSIDGTTYEWAVSEQDRAPIPAYVQFSMGKKGKGAPFEDLTTASRKLGEINPTFKLLDEGTTDVPGAKRASFLRFNISLDNKGAKVPVEQLQLYLDLPDGEVSTLRFIAPKGQWDSIMKPVYESLVVAESSKG